MYLDIWGIFVKYMGHICGNVLQIIVTNVRPGSLTKGSHHHNQTPLIALAPSPHLTCYHLLLCTFYPTLAIADCDCVCMIGPSVLIFTAMYHLLLFTFYTLTIEDCDYCGL